MSYRTDDDRKLLLEYTDWLDINNFSPSKMNKEKQAALVTAFLRQRATRQEGRQ